MTSIFKVNGQSLFTMLERESVNSLLTKSVNTTVNMLTLSARVPLIPLNFKNKVEVIIKEKLYLSPIFNLIT